MSAVRPTAQPPAKTYVMENAVRYGILMGGPKEIVCNGIGEYSVGHDHPLPRRELIEFQGINVGRKNESEAALADDSHALHRDWHKNPQRIAWKSPKTCAQDVFQTYGNRGFIVPQSLIGMPFADANQIFDVVFPPTARVLPLNEVVTFLAGGAPTDATQSKLHSELMAGAYKALEYVREDVLAIRTEIENASATGKGKKALGEVDREYFRELSQPLPEEVPAIATIAMGKELGKQFSQGSGRTDQLIAQLVEQNQLQAEANRLLREQASPTGGVITQTLQTDQAAESAPKTKRK